MSPAAAVAAAVSPAALGPAVATAVMQSVSVQRGLEALRLLLTTDIPAITGNQPIGARRLWPAVHNAARSPASSV